MTLPLVSTWDLLRAMMYGFISAIAFCGFHVNVVNNIWMYSFMQIDRAEFTCPTWFPIGAKSLIQRILDPNPETVSTECWNRPCICLCYSFVLCWIAGHVIQGDARGIRAAIWVGWPDLRLHLGNLTQHEHKINCVHLSCQPLTFPFAC